MAEAGGVEWSARRVPIAGGWFGAETSPGSFRDLLQRSVRGHAVVSVPLFAIIGRERTGGATEESNRQWTVRGNLE